MARLAERSGGWLRAGVMLAGLVAAGCATTQEQAARLRLNDARIRAAEVPTRVIRAGHSVAARLVTISSLQGTAFVVTARNLTHRPIADLPVSVGIGSGHGRAVDLNATSGLENSYFAAHLPPIGPGAAIIWVWTTGRRLAPRSRPFVLVGGAPVPALAVPARLPVIAATAVGPGAAGGEGGAIEVRVRNESSIPQYQLQVYAVAERSGRDVAAGRLTIPFVDAGGRWRGRVSLIGHPGAAQIQVRARATTVS